MNVSDYSTAELIEELIYRKVIRMHRLFTVDKVNVGGKRSAVKFSQKARFRYFVSLPDIDLDILPGVSDDELIRSTLTTELIESNSAHRWVVEEGSTLSPGE